MPAKIDREDLIDELHRLADQLGKVPTREEMNEHGQYSRTPYDTEFGGWNKALRAVGMNINKPVKLEREELLAELQQVANKIAKPPTMREFNDQSQYTERAVKREFGTWNNALREAGLEVNKPHDVEWPTLECGQCGEEYQVKPAREGLSRYCSNKCKNESKHDWVGGNNPHPNAGKRVTLTCEWCGDEYEAHIYESEQSRFCSVDCLGAYNGHSNQGENSPRWRGGYEDYYGPNWNEQRKQALKRDDHSCARCDKEQKLVVHHIEPYREFNKDNDDKAHKLSNLITLCRPCHAMVENSVTNGFGG